MVAVIVFDLETTGFCPMPLISNYHRVVQVAATRIDTDVNLHFSTFVNPEMLIPPQSSKIHRITNELVKDAPCWADAVDKMMLELDLDTQSEILMVAHNATHFDEIIFRKECLRDPPRIYLNNLTFGDSLPAVRKLYPGWESYRLEDVHRKLFGTGIDEAHRADADVDALVHIVKYMIDTWGINVLTPFTLTDSHHVSDMRFFGVYRSQKCYETTGASTIGELRSVLRADAWKYRIREWMQCDIGIGDITAQLTIISQLSQIPLHLGPQLINILFPGYTLRRHTARYEDCLNDVDYYIKKRYVDQGCSKNMTIYLRGLHKCFHQIKEF